MWGKGKNPQKPKQHKVVVVAMPSLKGMAPTAHVIGESSVKPGMPSKFVRNRQLPGGGGNKGVASAMMGTEAVAPRPMTVQDFATELLVNGYVQSYVDFFHLTHRPDPTIVDHSSPPPQIKVSLDDMVFIRDNLVRAETNRRQGNTSGAHMAYNRMADFYEAQEDFQTSIFFHKKCLDIAGMTSDMRAEMAADHALGTIYQRIGNFDVARRYHEHHEEIAQSIDMFDDIVKANTQLYKVYTYLADMNSEDGGNADVALELYNKSLVSAQKSMDKSAEGEANGKIGTLLLKLNMVSDSVQYLKRQSQIASDNGVLRVDAEHALLWHWHLTNLVNRRKHWQSSCLSAPSASRLAIYFYKIRQIVRWVLYFRKLGSLRIQWRLLASTSRY